MDALYSHVHRPCLSFSLVRALTSVTAHQVPTNQISCALSTQAGTLEEEEEETIAGVACRLQTRVGGA